MRINFYAGGGLDRAEPRRRDEAWVREQARHPEARYVLLWRNRNLVSADSSAAAALLLAPHEVPEHDPDQHDLAFLGFAGDQALFALDISPFEEEDAARLVGGRGAFMDLRAVGRILPGDQASVLAYARGLLYWHRRHRFCGRCGSPTVAESAGHVRRCTNCNLQHFPRTDPAVIMLVTDGEQCLLGRRPDWPAGMHSTLAGFVEPGESLEEAVRREVHEEVGLTVDTVVYHSSQPWPFPSSIMLGFHAHAPYGPITVDENELESAQWFTRDQILTRHEQPEESRLKLPRVDSIARRLVEDWLDGKTEI